MPMNVNWPRWIRASISKHFNDRRQSLPLFIEGQFRHTREHPLGIELRVDGPYLTEVSHDNWKHDYMINVLVTSVLNKQDLYAQDRAFGIVLAAFTDIMCYRFGNGPDDDGTFLCCLRIIHNDHKKQRTKANNFGQIEPTTELLQASVQASYQTYLDGTP